MTQFTYEDATILVRLGVTEVRGTTEKKPDGSWDSKTARATMSGWLAGYIEAGGPEDSPSFQETCDLLTSLYAQEIANSLLNTIKEDLHVN